MSTWQAFRQLNIPITRDSAQIREAYRNLLPLHHPEEDPQGFMELNQAYKTALAYARESEVSAERPPVFSQPSKAREHRYDPEVQFDSLFAGISQEQSHTDTDPQAKQEFSRQLRRLKRRWLNIPTRQWALLFSSGSYRLCRNDEPCMELLYDLVLSKIHFCGQLGFLQDRLWELALWQSNEDCRELATRTQQCIAQLRRQYSDYFDTRFSNRAQYAIYAACWAYTALPFSFKLLMSILLSPLFALPIAALFAAETGLILFIIILYFYCLEYGILHTKKRRGLGFCHSAKWYRKLQSNASRTGFGVVAAIYGIGFHIIACVHWMELIADWFAISI